MSPPRTPSLQLFSLNVNGLRGRQKRAALFAALQAGPWHVVALQETHHASQAEAAQWCREGAGPTAPWDGPSFWASGTSASRGVALLFKASPLLSSITPAVVDPNGRFVAAQGNLCGCQITLASVDAPVERQERAPFFQHSLMPALPAGTPLALGGDWNCVAGDQDLVGDSQAPASQISTLDCCPCSRHWGCWMLFGTYTPKLASLPTQPPQAHPQPELTCGLSVTAWSQLSAQQQSRTFSQLTIMGSLCHSHQLQHLHACLACGQCHLLLSHILPSRLS